MNWQIFRKKKPFQSGASNSKSSPSLNNKLVADVEPTTSVPTVIDDIAKILVIGETGSGKSTFINYLTNHFRGGTYDNPRIAIPTRYHQKMTESFGHCENALDDVTISKTDACRQYMFHDSETNRKYLFLDTPGLGDTRGAQQDQTNIENILNSINDLQGLTSVIIVVNGSMARVTTNFRSVLLGLRGNLPDIVMDNVILILSHVKRHQSTFDIKRTLKMNGTNVYPYYMQNSAFAQDPKSWGSHEQQHIERDWVESMQEIQEMLLTIGTFQTKSVSAFNDMRAIRNAIKTCMHEARLEITKAQRMHDEILIFEQAVKKYHGEEISYQDYTQERTITVNELVDAPYHSTICEICDFVCHQQCSLNETQESGNQIFEGCAAMDHEKNCKKCPDKCSSSEHYHARKMMKTSEQTLTTVLHDIKEKFDIATKHKNDFEHKLTSAQDSRKLMDQALRQKIDAVQAQCRELRKVCGSFNLAQELYTLVEQLKIEAQMLTSLEARSKADVVIRELNAFCQSLEAQEHNTTTSKNEMVVVDTGSGSDKTAAKFISNTRTKLQESHERVTVVEKILEAQLKKKKAPVPVTNPSEPILYEPIGDEYQEEPQFPNSRKSSSNQKKPDRQKSQQPPKLPERLSQKNSRGHSDRSSSTMSSSNNEYGSIYSAEPPTSKATKSRYELLTIEELVDEFHAAVAQNRSKAAIERELRNRAQGITCPMVTSSDRAMFARYTNKYSHMSSAEISYQYMRLQKHINSRLGNDNMDMEKLITIPSELLVELAALYTLFSSEESATTEENDYNRSPSPPAYKTTRQRQPNYSQNDYDRSPSPPTFRTNRSHQPSYSQDSDNIRSQRHIHNSSATQQSTYSTSGWQDRNNQRLRSGTHIDENTSLPPSYDDAVRLVEQSLPRPRSSSTTPIGQGQVKERQINDTRLPNRKPPISYDARPSLDNNKNRNQTNSQPDFVRMTNDELVELYSHARKLEDTVQQIAIYTHLEKRCNGEYNRLMTDPMMEQILDRYEQLETAKLHDKLNATKAEIRKLTKGGDATKIQNVSKDLLIKITAINSILRDRPADNKFF